MYIFQYFDNFSIIASNMDKNYIIAGKYEQFGDTLELIRGIMF